ncbi:hypothetical protein D1BOALGB6SA_2431 [Olavius sp. associated proteobacterium Delta 1]|nr:hypothetical protein D1BOALGB6SA_2431 [Olavius sp. associated proteobacterium Delta 1]
MPAMSRQSDRFIRNLAGIVVSPKNNRQINVVKSRQKARAVTDTASLSAINFTNHL